VTGAAARGADQKELIRSRVDLLDVVQEHVRLTRRGREFVGLCPFHQEKSPSFTLNQQLQSWYCFGCNKGGDLFSFVEQIEKTDFRGALETLAERAGVELTAESSAARVRSQLRRRVIEMNRLAIRYYEYVLHETSAGEPGQRLLAGRQVSDEVARRFQLGFAPARSSFSEWLRKRQQPIADAVAAGLVRRDGTDFFQERLLIPIRDEKGQPLAFTGRTIHPAEPRKYVNTAETPAYVKGRVLFALDLAKDEISTRGHAVLMEGQFDVIVAHQFGVLNAVASSGTALTEDQVRLLSRFTEEVVLVFDSDDAGKAAAFKAIEQAASKGLRSRVGQVVGAKDPDEFLRGAGEEAPARWEQLLAAALPGWEYWVKDAIRGLNPGRPEGLEVARERVNTILGRISDPAVRESYREKAAAWLGVPPHLMTVTASAPRLPVVTNGRLDQPRAGKKMTSGRYLLQILAVRADALERIRAGLDPDDLELEDRQTYLSMVQILERGGQELLVRELPSFDDEAQDMIRRAWASPPPSVDDAVVDDLLRNVKQRALRDRRRRAISELVEAERLGDKQRAAELGKTLDELGGSLKALRESRVEN
jgi:DNA primase